MLLLDTEESGTHLSNVLFASLVARGFELRTEYQMWRVCNQELDESHSYTVQSPEETFCT